MKKVPVKIKTTNNAKIPIYNHDGDSGFDLVATNFKFYNPESKSIEEYPNGARKVSIAPGGRLLVGTDLYMAIPKGYELQVRSRSGNTLKEGYVVGNSPGTVDSPYRGEIGVIIQNNGREIVTISIGDKVAQGVITEVTQADFSVVEDLDSTTRNEGGFGSTNK